MKEKISEHLKEIMAGLGALIPVPTLDYPEDTTNGDFSSNVAMANAKNLGIPPKVLAEKIVMEFKNKMPEYLKDIRVAGPGFINFFVKDEVVAKEMVAVSNEYGKSKNENGRQILVEYTDPNIFKVFHIGHLMANAVGESISRLIEYSGASVVRICYPSDIGLHIAKSVWAVQKYLSGDLNKLPAESAPIQERTDFLGKMYVVGTNAYDADPVAKSEIDTLNKVLYEKSDPAVNEIYEKGRKWSLAHFELLYKTLGTKFDNYFYESEMAMIGLDTVHKFLDKGVFEKSDGAIVFKGEKYGLHTRVFVNAHGIPTYEAKDLGLNMAKFEKYPDADRSIIVTASEQNDYFRVLSKVFSLVDEENGLKTEHIGHGMMRFQAGKMSSRTGNVITAESLLQDMKDLVKEKISGREFSVEESDEISEMIAVGAIKYTILRSSIGSDIVFDSAASISFEGDSGPYLQYSAVRANSILEKAEKEGIAKLDVASLKSEAMPDEVSLVEKLITRFPDLVLRARDEHAPQVIANYLIALSGAFNSFYASQIIVNKKDPLSSYYVALTKAFLITMTNGLWLLGIKVPGKM